MDTRVALDSFAKEDTIELNDNEIAFEKIDMPIGKVQGITAYKSLNSLDAIGKTEKRYLKRHLMLSYLCNQIIQKS